MNRRFFIKNTSLASLAIPEVARTIPNPTLNKLHIATAEESLDVVEATIDELQKRMETNKLTARQLTTIYLNRIQAIDQAGPALNSVIELNPDALSIAEALDKERSNGIVRSALHGIPILIKDNINTGDQMMTTAGSLALVGNKADKDAFIITLLREAGAVLLGKTNLSEFSNFRGSHSTSGWSSRGGQTKSPYVLNRTPSGSSAGTGSAVAANLCVVGIGTDTGGSIINPSSRNNLVGIKPTVGLWSRSGIIPISTTQDTAGPMARTVRDAAILLGALAGTDPADEVTNHNRNKVHKDYTQFLAASSLRGKRLGFDPAGLQGNGDVIALTQQTLDVLKAKGAIIVEVELAQLIADLDDAEFTVLQYEFKDGLNKYLARAHAPVKSLQELIAFNQANENRTMPYFKQELLVSSEETKGLTNKNYKDAVAKSTSARKVIDALLKRHQLDAFVGVSKGLSCCIDLVNGDYDTGFSAMSSPAAKAGYPHITVPMGFVHQLPVGFSFFSTAYSEPQLLAMAYAFEQATHQRKAPTFLERIG